MDPALWELLEEGESQDEVAAIIRLEKPGILPEGVRIIAQFGDIVTCRLQRNTILEVRAESAVASFKAPRLLVPDPVGDYQTNQESRYKSLSWVDERRPLSEEATGRGVVVGIVDWGFDFAHPEFRHADGSTRILALWDQQTHLQRQPPYPYGYGVVHTQEAINRALKAANPYAALGYHPGDVDPNGEGTHGTHVASIAAGNGRGGGPVGIAPEADLVFVHMGNLDSQKKTNLGDSVSLLEALDFIAKTAGNRPWVINLSMGRHGEQHDGTTLVEQGLDAILNAAPNRAIVQSVGNYFDRCIHTQGTIRPGEVKSFIWRVDAADVTANQLEIWYSGRDVLVVELKTANGVVPEQVKLGDRTTINMQGRIVGNIYHRTKEPNNLDNHINIFLYPNAPPGDWEVRLIAQDVVDGRFHAWIERDLALPHCQSRFCAQDAVENGTTGTICNGYRTIAVGAYNAHSKERAIASFSSAGPTRDGRTKPDLVAPGVSILAARSASRHTHGETSLHTRKSGTSMAAPHVTGTVALMFEVARQPLLIEDTRNLLLATTQKISVEEELFRIGSGYLDIKEAVNAARQFRKSQKAHSIAMANMQQSDEVAVSHWKNADVININDAVMDIFPQAQEWEDELGCCGGETDAEAMVAPEPLQLKEVVASQFPEVKAMSTDVTDIKDAIMDTLPQEGADEFEWCGGYEADAEMAQEEMAASQFGEMNLMSTDITDIKDAMMDALPQEADELEWCGGYEADTEAVIENILPAGENNQINGRGWYPSLPAESANLRLVDWAEEAVAAEASSSHSVNTINYVLSKAGIAESLSLMKEGKILSPATLFDAFTSNRNPSLKRHFAQFFEMVAAPGESLAQSLQPGDILVRRALGEGKFGHIAVVADAQLRSQEELLKVGVQAEANYQGFYVQVVEGGAKPHRRHDAFARRVLDSNGRLSRDQLVLRPTF